MDRLDISFSGNKNIGHHKVRPDCKSALAGRTIARRIQTDVRIPVGFVKAISPNFP